MKKAVIFLMLCLSVSSWADGSGFGTITQFYVNRAGNLVRIHFSEPIVNPSNCGGAAFYIGELDDTPGSDRFYSALLAAYTAKKQVNFWISGCTQGSWWGSTRPKIADIYIKD